MASRWLTIGIAAVVLGHAVAASAAYVPKGSDAPASPTGDYSRQLRVPDLRDPRLRVLFRRQIAAACRSRGALVERQQRSTLPEGSFVGQDHKPGSVYTCDTVTYDVSTGPPLEPREPSYPPPAETPPLPLRIGTLDSAARVRGFERASAARCDGVAADVQSTPRESRRPRGSYDGQNPEAGTIYRCGMPVQVWTSLGPPPTAEAPLLVGDLSQDGGSGLRQRVRLRCDEPLAIDNQTEPNASGEGSFVRQSPPPETAYTCGMGVIIVRSSGPPPAPVAEPEPKPEPKPKPGPETKPKAKPEPKPKPPPAPVPPATVEPKPNPPPPPPAPVEPLPAPTRDPVPPAPGPSAVPPRAVRNWTVPDLSGPDPAARVAAAAQAACGAAPTLEMRSVADSSPTGAFLRQTPAPQTSVACGTAVVIERSAGTDSRAWVYEAIAAVVALLAGVALWLRSLARTRTIAATRVECGLPVPAVEAVDAAPAGDLPGITLLALPATVAAIAPDPLPIAAEEPKTGGGDG